MMLLRLAVLLIGFGGLIVGTGFYSTYTFRDLQYNSYVDGCVAAGGTQEFCTQSADDHAHRT